MALRNTHVRWGMLSQLFHWLIVVLLILQVTLASLADDLPPGARKLALLARHKSVGITILMLVILRLLWRSLNPTPLLPTTLKPYERTLARSTHALLYLLLFAMPLSGWMMSSARGFPVSWFGFFTLPDLVPKSRPLYDAFILMHQALAWVLAAVVVLHVAAALKHHFMLRDDVLRRMLPFALLLALAPLGAPAGHAAAAAAPTHYALDLAKSSLEFSFLQAGAQNKGRFRHFQVSFDFSPDDLAASRLDVIVEVSSLDTGDPERDDTLRGADLFAVAKFPQAHFAASQVVRTPGGYEAVGKLTLRDTTRAARVPFTFRTATENGAPVGYMTGRTSVRRLDYGVGQGDWRATDQVGNEVGVSFALRLAASH